MEWCVKYPKEAILIVRPSLRKACGGNRNAAKLLSYLLYCASNLEVQLDKQLKKFVAICRTQGQIADDIDEELSTRTLRDEAIPCLVDLGYLSTEDVRGNKQYTIYTIYPDAIQNGINAPDQVPNYKTLPYYVERDRKNFRAENSPNGSEVFPNGSEKFPSRKHRASGKISERKSGNKGAPQAPSTAVSEMPENKKEIYTEKDTEGGPSFSKEVPYFIKDTVRKCSSERGERVTTDDNIAYTHEIYVTSGIKQKDFREILAQSERETRGSGMESFFKRLCKLSHVEYAVRAVS